MDSKILCISLLVAVSCLWSIEAGSGAERDEKYVLDVDYIKGDEDTRSAINEHTAKVAGMTAKNYVNKARTKEAESRLCAQCAKDRYYYYREYNRVAHKYKQRARELEQVHVAEASRIGEHAARQRDWESKAREAHTQCKQEDQKAQELYTRAREAKRDAILSYAKEAIHEALASGYAMKAERAKEISRDLRRKADIMSHDAKVHYMRGKEDQNKANSEKVKALQQAQDSQRHLSASRAYQQEAIRTRLSSRSNIMKYIQSSLLAERHNSLKKEEIIKSEMNDKMAQDYARMSEETSGIVHHLMGLANIYASKAKQAESKAYEYGESKKLMGTEVAETSQGLYIAQARDEETDEESGQPRLSSYPADDALKAMPSEDKNPMFSAETGMR